MPTLSIVMIVKNEAKNLAACLDSVRHIADEIVLGDTGSTDETLAVAQSYNPVVLHVPWRDDFAQARNAVLAKATGDWLLHLDADEVMDPSGAARIREIVDSNRTDADAIEVTLANYCDDPRAWRWTPCAPNDPASRGFSGYIKVGLLRLFRNHRGFEYREPVHENITESVAVRGGVVRAEPILIHHYGYTPPQRAASTKQRFYLEIGQKKATERPNDPKAWHDLAEQLLASGAAAQSEEACRKALTLAPSHLGAVMTLANLLLNRGAYAEARTLLEGLESAGSAPAHALIALGAIAIRDGRMDEAIPRLEAALAADPTSVMAALYLARAYDILGNPERARVILAAAHAHTPNLKEVEVRGESLRVRTEGEDLFAHGHFREALERMVEALRLDPDDPVTHNNIGVLTLALGDRNRAGESFRRALILAPGLRQAQENLHGLS